MTSAFAAAVESAADVNCDDDDVDRRYLMNLWLNDLNSDSTDFDCDLTADDESWGSSVPVGWAMLSMNLSMSRGSVTEGMKVGDVKAKAQSTLLKVSDPSFSVEVFPFVVHDLKRG